MGDSKIQGSASITSLRKWPSKEREQQKQCSRRKLLLEPPRPESNGSDGMLATRIWPV